MRVAHAIKAAITAFQKELNRPDLVRLQNVFFRFSGNDTIITLNIVVPFHADLWEEIENGGNRQMGIHFRFIRNHACITLDLRDPFHQSLWDASATLLHTETGSVRCLNLQHTVSALLARVWQPDTPMGEQQLLNLCQTAKDHGAIDLLIEVVS